MWLPLCFVLLRVAASALFVDRDPKSDSFVAMPHGRVSMALCVMKVLLAVAFGLHHVLGGAALLAVTSASALTQLYALFTYLPFFNPDCMALHASFATLHAWATVCAVAAAVSGIPRAFAAFDVVRMCTSVVSELLHEGRKVLLGLVAFQVRGVPEENLEASLLLFGAPWVLCSGYFIAKFRYFGFGGAGYRGALATAAAAAAPAGACMIELRQRQVRACRLLDAKVS